MSSDDLDEAIDEAVRGLMSGEPAAGLRARVMRGIDAPEPRRLFAWPRPALAAGTAAVAALVMLQVSRGPEVTDMVTAPVAAPAVVTAPAPLAVPPVRTADATAHQDTPAPGPSLHAPVTHTPPASNSRMVSAASVIDVDAEPMGVRPLDAMRPIAIEPLGHKALQLSEIVIVPLQFDAVRVEPLSSPPR